MPDYLPFERITYSKPSIASISEAIWIWHILTDALAPGGYAGDYLIYTMPSGLKGVISDISVSLTMKGASKFFISSGDNIFFCCQEAFIPSNLSFQLPPVAEPGQSLYFRFWNFDIIYGQLLATFSMWNVPGSQPEKPKSDDPEERFRVGDFSSCDVFFLSPEEAVYIFRKRNENKANYLRIKRNEKKKEKILAKSHLDLDKFSKMSKFLEETLREGNKSVDKIEKEFKIIKKGL